MFHKYRICRIASLLAASVLWAVQAGRAADEPEPMNPFFAFDNGTGRDRLPFEQQAQMLKELGFHGIGYTGTAGIAELLAAFDAHGLTVFSTYVQAHVDSDKPAYDPGLPDAIKQLNGRETVLWLYILGGRPSGVEHDERAVEIIRELSDMAAESGLRVALYPHVGFYVATVDDALRLAEKAARPNVGVSFNLCHFLKLDAEHNIKATLERAMPRLMLVSINGANRGDTRQMGWDRLIQPLDQGDFDNGELLATLRTLGYRGPVGLQCYGIPGEPREHLPGSMKAWQRIGDQQE